MTIRRTDEKCVAGELLITCIEWERVWMTITLSFSRPPDNEVEFIIYDALRAYPVEAVPTRAGVFVARINVTNFRNRQQVPNGSWRFMAVLDGERGPTASFPLELAADLDAAGRSYLYNQDRSAYVVSFGLSQEDRADVIMRTYQLNRLSSAEGASNQPVRAKSNVAHSSHQSLLRRGFNAMNRITGGLTGRLFAKLDSAAAGGVSAFAHRQLYRIRSTKLRVNVALRARDLSLLAEPRSKDIAMAEIEAPTFAKARTRRDGPVRVLFASEMRPALAGNLLRIRDRMLERGLDKTYDMAYSFRTLDTVTAEGTLTLASEVNAADIVLIDDYFPLLNKIKLREDHRLIQVWHAGSGFKSVGYSRFGSPGSPRLSDTHRKYTFAICGAAHLVPVYAEVFGIPESAVIPTGLPRIDSFLDPVHVEKVTSEFRDSYPRFSGKRKILFAPTFRGEGARTAFYNYSQLDFERIYDMCGDEFVFLIRMHHFIAEAPPIPQQYADRIFNFSHYPDGNDLLHSIDILITDYSSILYEFSLLDRPMLFFAYDRDLYAATRGFHRPYEEMAPGRVCLTFDELIEAIENEDFEEWRIAAFRSENFDYMDTGSADRVIDQLILADPRLSPEAVAARQRDDARLERAQRLAAEQMHHDNPEHAGAIAALDQYSQRDAAPGGKKL